VFVAVFSSSPREEFVSLSNYLIICLFVFLSADRPRCNVDECREALGGLRQNRKKTDWIFSRSYYSLTIALMLLQCCVPRRLSSSSSSVTLCVVTKQCVLEQKLSLTAYRKSHMRNRLVPKWMTLTFV